MYAFLKIDGYDNSLEVAQRLARDAKLGLAPGAAFGPEGEGWLRWCHATSEAKLEEGISRLRDFLPVSYFAAGFVSSSPLPRR